MKHSQACIISFLITKGFIKVTPVPNKRSTIDTTLQDLLICYEMLIAAIAHLYAFSHKSFIDLAMENESPCYSFMRVLDFSDERTDLTDHVHQICKYLLSTAFKLKPNSLQIHRLSLSQILESDCSWVIGTDEPTHRQTIATTRC